MAWPTPQFAPPSQPGSLLHVTGITSWQRTHMPEDLLHPNWLPAHVGPTTGLLIDLSALMPGSPWCGAFSPAAPATTTTLEMLSERCGTTIVRWDVSAEDLSPYRARAEQALQLADIVATVPGIDAPGDRVHVVPVGAERERIPEIQGTERSR